MSTKLLRWDTVAFCSEKDAFDDLDEQDDFDLDDIDFNEIDEVGELEDDTGMLFPPRQRFDVNKDGDQDDGDDDDDDEFDELRGFPLTEKDREEQDKLFDLWFAQFHQRLFEQHCLNLLSDQCLEEQHSQQ